MTRKCTITTFGLLVFLSLASVAAAENWVEYCVENWSYRSDKLHKELYFNNRYYFDSDSVKRNRAGELRVWIKEISAVDRFYVAKGSPEWETSFRHLQLWCTKNKYMIVMEEGVGEVHESLMEEIVPGTQYAKLYDKLCNER